MGGRILWKSGASPDQQPLLHPLACPLVDQTNWWIVDKKIIQVSPVVDNLFTKFSNHGRQSFLSSSIGMQSSTYKDV